MLSSQTSNLVQPLSSCTPAMVLGTMQDDMILKGFFRGLLFRHLKSQLNFPLANHAMLLELLDFAVLAWKRCQPRTCQEPYLRVFV